MGPEYPDYGYQPNDEWLKKLTDTPSKITQAARQWIWHASMFLHYAESDDVTGEKTGRLGNHTRLLSLVCDRLLHIDPTTFTDALECVITLSRLHQNRRIAPQDMMLDEEFAVRIEHHNARFIDLRRRVNRLTDRIGDICTDATKSPEPTNEPPAELLQELSKRSSQLLRFLWKNPKTTIDTISRRLYADEAVQDASVVAAIKSLQHKLHNAGFGHFTVTEKNGIVIFER